MHPLLYGALLGSGAAGALVFAYSVVTFTNVFSLIHNNAYARSLIVLGGVGGVAFAYMQ